MSLSKVKISYNGETKRVSSVSKTYNDLISFIKLLGFKELRNATDIKLYYKDSEDDLVSVANEEEFNDAL
jgi:hypothetical protein